MPDGICDECHGFHQDAGEKLIVIVYDKPYKVCLSCAGQLAREDDIDKYGPVHDR